MSRVVTLRPLKMASLKFVLPHHPHLPNSPDAMTGPGVRRNDKDPRPGPRGEPTPASHPRPELPIRSETKKEWLKRKEK